MDWATLTSISSYRHFDLHNPEEKDGSAEEYFFQRPEPGEERPVRAGAASGREAGTQLALDDRSQRHLRTRQADQRHSPQPADPGQADLGGEIGIPYGTLPDGVPIDLCLFHPVPDPFGERTVTSGAQALADDIAYREQIRINAKYRSYAGFARCHLRHHRYPVLTAGLRYTYDDKNFGALSSNNDYVVAFAFPLKPGWTATAITTPMATWDSCNPTRLVQDHPRVVLEWQAQEEDVYASYPRAGKAGASTAPGRFSRRPSTRRRSPITRWG